MACALACSDAKEVAALLEESALLPAQQASETAGSQSAEAPSYALRFLQQAEIEPGRWEARLLERDEAGRVEPWAWRVLLCGDPDPRLVYDERAFPFSPSSGYLLEVRLREGDWLARQPVASAAGVAPEPIEMTLVQVSVFGGKVVDEQDRPVANAELRLRQESGSVLEPLLHQPLIVWSDLQGGFLFGGVEPGQHHLRVRSEGRVDVQLEVTLTGGQSDGYQLRLPDVEQTSGLPIALLGANDGQLPQALVTLRALNGQHVWRSVHTASSSDAQVEIQRAGVGYAILFPHLPLGNYELSVLGMDGQLYEPQRSILRFAQLAEGLRLAAVAPGKTHELRFILRDAETQELLGGAGVRFSAGDWWSLGGFLLDGSGPAPEQLAAVLPDNVPTPDWMIVREGYRPAYGSFAPTADLEGAVVEELELRPGWGCELNFRDGSQRLPRPAADSWTRSAAVHMARPLADVLVLADGKQVGRSDEHGRVRIELAQRPARLSFKRAGWQDLPAISTGFSDAHDTRLLGSTGAAVVWFDVLAEPSPLTFDQGR